MNSLTVRLSRGAGQGIKVALWYAVFEYIFYEMAVVFKPHRVMLAQQWRGTVVLFACYIVFGALLGTASAWFMRKRAFDDSDIQNATTLEIVAALVLGSFVAELGAAPRICFDGAALLVGAAVLFDAGGVWSILKECPGVFFGCLIFAGWVACSPVVQGIPVYVWIPGLWAAVIAILVSTVVVARLMAFLAAQYRWSKWVSNAARACVVFGLCFGPNITSSRAKETRPVWRTSTAAPTTAPNVVLVTLDTVGANHMGIYGYERANTPHLKQFLKESTFYSRFIAAAPLTLTSHASIFTGLYPQSHGAYKGFRNYSTGRPLAPNIPTLAEILDRSGYHTMAVAANRFYLNEAFGTLRGFQFIHWLAPTVLVSQDRDYVLRNRIRNLLRFTTIPRNFDSNTIPGELVNQQAFALLDKEKNGNSPFFLFLNYMDAHAPYLPPPPYCDLYPGRDLGFSMGDYGRMLESVNVKDQPIDARSRDHNVSQYDGAIAYLDMLMGELIAHLKANGQYDRTLIIITSDHGESLGAKNLVEHDSSVYQDQVRIPLIVKYPGQRQGERVDTLASHVDLMPTVLDAAGVKPPPTMQGVDLRRLPSLPDRVVVAEMHGSALYDVPRFRQIEWALYDGSRKMIYSDHGVRELYDLAADPGELHNLYRIGAPEIAELRSRLVNWSTHTVPEYQDAMSADREVLKRLESLGYAHQNN